MAHERRVVSYTGVRQGRQVRIVEMASILAMVGTSQCQRRVLTGSEDEAWEERLVKRSGVRVPEVWCITEVHWDTCIVEV